MENDGQDPFAGYDIHHLSIDIQAMYPVPGMYSYSHIGYALLYWLFERVGGLEYFAQRTFRQYHLTGDGVGWNISDAHISPGHGFHGRIRPAWHTGSMEPAMGLKSTMSQLLYYLRLIAPVFHERIPELTAPLKRELRALERAGAYRVEEGWFLIRSGRSMIYYHNGRTGGHHVSVAFMPQLQKGVVVISNGAAVSNELSLQVLHMLRRVR
jgi:CubicO group peptidase (beta-lactamase class C family)